MDSSGLLCVCVAESPERVALHGAREEDGGSRVLPGHPLPHGYVGDRQSAANVRSSLPTQLTMSSGHWLGWEKRKTLYPFNIPFPIHLFSTYIHIHTPSLGITHAALRARNVDLPDSLVAMTGSSRKNLRGFDIQSQNEEEGRKDDDAYYATDGSL